MQEGHMLQNRVLRNEMAKVFDTRNFYAARLLSSFQYVDRLFLKPELKIGAMSLQFRQRKIIIICHITDGAVEM